MEQRTQELRNELMEQIGKRQEELLQVLKQIFAKSDHNSLVFNLIGRINSFKRDEISGTLNQSELTQERNKINNSLIKLIELVDDDLVKAYELETAIFNKILVVCPSVEREQYLKNLLPSHRYKEVEFDHSRKSHPKDEVNTFDLVIFDNLPNTKKEDNQEIFDPKELLLYYLNETNPYVLYLGPFIGFINDYPEKVYASNSVFSIHARIMEMVTFIKYDRRKPRSS